MKYTWYRVKEDPLPVRKGDGLLFEVYENGRWVKEKGCRLKDLYMGYDPYETEKSPYGIGNTSVMDELTEIDEEQAREMIRKAEKKV